MKKIFNTPTGKLFIDNYSKGELETLSIGDYGKQHNIKAKFLGFTEDINGVTKKEIMPLSEKWVITVSTQYGCPQKCTFCDVPNVKFKGNAAYEDLMKQIYNAISIYPEVKYTDRLNIHYARMGEPMLNTEEVFYHAIKMGNVKFKHDLVEEFSLRVEVIHPVFTTMLPKSVSIEKTKERLNEWTRIKNDIYKGQAGLQLSINSTSEKQRNEMFAGRAHSLLNISKMCDSLEPPVGRKYTLNFALADGYEVDADKLRKLFSPEKFMVKITPIHNNNACAENNIKTSNGYNFFAPYRGAEDDLIKAGFDVLIFIPSEDEENNTITCGNAILGGSKIKKLLGDKK
jgi:23S rRNA (adenine2503-C2)-methyltransferase